MFTFILPIQNVKDAFNVQCKRGIIWAPNGFLAELFVTVHMFITMIYLTLYYIVFWSIPYRYN